MTTTTLIDPANGYNSDNVALFALVKTQAQTYHLLYRKLDVKRHLRRRELEGDDAMGDDTTMKTKCSSVKRLLCHQDLPQNLHLYETEVDETEVKVPVLMRKSGTGTATSSEKDRDDFHDYLIYSLYY